MGVKEAPTRLEQSTRRDAGQPAPQRRTGAASAPVAGVVQPMASSAAAVAATATVMSAMGELAAASYTIGVGQGKKVRCDTLWVPEHVSRGKVSVKCWDHPEVSAPRAVPAAVAYISGVSRMREFSVRRDWQWMKLPTPIAHGRTSQSLSNAR